MKWPFITSLTSSVALLIGSFYLLQYQPVATFIKTNEAVLINLNSIALVATVFSLLFAIFTYYAQRAEGKRIRKQNHESLVENALVEIDTDLEIVHFAETNFHSFQTILGGLPSNKFLVFSLQKIVDFIRSREVRRNILLAIAEMKKADQVIDTIASYRGPMVPKSQMSAYMKMRKINLQKFKEMITEAKKHLNFIKQELSKDKVEFLE